LSQTLVYIICIICRCIASCSAIVSSADLKTRLCFWVGAKRAIGSKPSQDLDSHPAPFPASLPFSLMSFNILLIQLVLFSCVFSLLRRPRLPHGWVLVSSGILAVLAITFLLVPDLAGWISGGLWGLLVLLPLVGFTQVNRLFYQERYHLARRLSLCLRWLHPVDGWWEYPEILRGLELGQQGRMDEAAAILNHYGASSQPTGRIATALLYRLGARWDELLGWIRQNWAEEVVVQDAVLGIYYLRSLGETGDLNGLIQGLEKFEHRLEKSNDGISLNLARMIAFAFAGQPDQVRQLFHNSSLGIYSRDTRQFWTATAELAAGNEAAREQLQVLAHRCDSAMQNAIRWRLTRPLRNPQRELSSTSRQILAQLETTIQQESRYGGRSTLTSRKPYATYILIAINLVAFALEIAWGGSENLDTLYRMGALVPEEVLAGDWWRLITAIFLHYGAVHLLANMLGLYILGIFVERTLGTGKFLLCYFFSGIGSMVAITILGILASVPNLIGVGASGAIMGILGVMAAILLKGWRHEKAKIAAKRLRLVLLIVVLQVVSDIFTPQVSLVGHVSGFVLGFLSGVVLFRVSHLKSFTNSSSGRSS
jgi:rhomboid protease GluP